VGGLKAVEKNSAAEKEKGKSGRARLGMGKSKAPWSVDEHKYALALHARRSRGFRDRENMVPRWSEECASLGRSIDHLLSM
jgi:hypothetical protein